MKLFTLLFKKNSLMLILVVGFGMLASRYLFLGGYFNMHDDLQMMRQLELEKCFADGQIPCRWVPDMGYGYGYPLFNYYPPLPYLIGQVIRIFGYSFADTVKAVFILAFVTSGVSMYFFSKEFFGKLGGALAAIFYIWAPYHAVDIYVRGAMNESWALVWFPLVLLFSYKIVIESKKLRQYVIGLAVSFAMLLLSHNLMALIFTPVLLVWCFLWIIYSKNVQSLIYLAISAVWSVGFAAFFTLPVFLEKGLVQTNTLVTGYYEYTAHFASLSQILFSRFWGYGPSVWMTQDDKMSFQVGHLHWLLPLLVIAGICIHYYKTRKVNPGFIAVCFLFVIGWVATFMIHPRSTPLWSTIEQLKFVQFPWRFLTIVIFCFSFCIGGLRLLVPKLLFIPLSTVLILSVVAFNWGYFTPENGRMGPLTDEQKFSAAAWELQQTAGIYDYLPVTAKTAPKAPRSVVAEVIEGSGTISQVSEGTDWMQFVFEGSKDSVLRLNLLDFQDWVVKVDDKEVQKFIPDEEQWGRIYLNIPQGRSTVSVKLHNTPIRVVGNVLTLISWSALGIILLRKKRPSVK